MLWTDTSKLLRRLLLGAAAMGASLSMPAFAAEALSTRLVSCGEESCLLVSGTRTDANALVAINGRVVAVEGARKWRVRVPVNTLRQWSAPSARTIMVLIDGVPDEADLPIGMLMGVEHLAMLTITAK